MDEPARADRLTSDLADLDRVDITALRSVPRSLRAGRLLEEVRRARGRASVDTPPGRAE
ncbi:aldo/keto reductase [Streptomyces hiroshimensis]|uniref:FXSXX-COOH protein n=1 Tax=Streptomyces hiroshimensis TaxID=66424 RepID=A0ABQ2Y5S9_9ACTN|nr:aldo/keto reductase [Streptomyces hiroshimensis]GGX64070.1 hypothetical protein GCM10010324_06110 [Streptomyces hiroshimensis]